MSEPIQTPPLPPNRAEKRVRAGVSLRTLVGVLGLLLGGWSSVAWTQVSNVPPNPAQAPPAPPGPYVPNNPTSPPATGLAPPLLPPAYGQGDVPLIDQTTPGPGTPRVLEVQARPAVPPNSSQTGFPTIIPIETSRRRGKDQAQGHRRHPRLHGLDPPEAPRTHTAHTPRSSHGPGLRHD